ncbi:ABC transporter substrate-binding protein [Paracraurococcus ruber]|uniref:Amino acid ABC transporter n=1 Tax=Paracraurococcus ruber TaxID=77675 RepID=A0ABS1CXJ8_9PROT|nr:ABC transporter substrate-binding protein [Paracraurococcus ruber]MBK1658444.1 amino acid ABC transporter [Paracraurococcus ruber]TDG32115.1 ABC transporter substrate-binding protein [Paracraurococcus ruber]
MLRRCILAAALLATPLADPVAVKAQPACAPRVADSELVKPRTLVLSTNPTLPPMQFVDSQGVLRGMRVELGTEIARRLCLTPEHVRIEFAAMIPGLAARRWDMINTGMFYTEERAKLMQLVRYEEQAISISVPRGNPRSIRRIEDLAGLTVGVEQGGFEFRRTQDLAKELQDKGLRPITIRPFDNFAISFQALRAGQLDAAISIDSTGKEYDERGEFTRAISGLFGTPINFGFRSKVLATAVAQVLTEMRNDGSFQTLLDRHGVKAFDGPFEVVGPN